MRLFGWAFGLATALALVSCQTPSAGPAPPATISHSPTLTPVVAAPPVAPSPTVTSHPRLLLLDAEHVYESAEQVRKGYSSIEPAAARLRRDADSAMKSGPFSVMQKKGMPPSSDRHDYLSLSIYYWPDPAKADGKPYIRKDGQVNPESRSDYYDSEAMGRMAYAVRTLGLASYVLGNAAYGSRAAELLRTWFIDPATRMNPNLNYAQGVPGRSAGRPSGIIDSVRLLDVLDASRLLDVKVWPWADREALQSWFRDYLAWLQTSRSGRAEGAARNNHGTWYDAQVTAFALFTGDDSLAVRVLNSSAKARIAAQIESDGRQPLEIARTKSLRYSLYNLEAFITLAELGRRVEVDLWGYSTTDGRSIGKALEFVKPALLGQKWPYPDIDSSSVTSFARYLRMAAAGLKDPGYLDIADKLLDRNAASDRSNLLFRR